MLVISDRPEQLPGVRVETVFRRGAGLRNLVHVLRLRRVVRKFAPDIVHGHYLTVGGLYAALSGGKRIVGSAWGTDIYGKSSSSFVEGSILKFVLRRCDLVFAGTKDMADKIRDFGYDGEIAMFRWGPDPAVFKQTTGHGSSEFRVVSIRPCGEIYNPLAIVKGFQAALPAIGDAYLYLLDFGNAIAEVHELVESDPEMVRHVRFLPSRPYDAMPALYNMADVAISVPKSDSAAASVLEAMSCETPVIASDIPSMRDWIDDGVNGFITGTDPEKLAEVLRKAYSVRSRLPEMGRLARQKVTDDATQGTFGSSLRVAEASYDSLLKRPA